MNSYDAVIIGAGVIGCSIALALSRAGMTTLNVDQLPAPGYGSTSHSSAIIRPFYSHFTSVAIAHESRCRWRNWADFLDHTDESGMAQYQETGGLILVRDGTEDNYDANIKALDEAGVDYQWLTSAEVTAMYPGICLDAFGPPRARESTGFGEPVEGRLSGGIYLPEAGYVSDPQLAAHNLASAATRLGARFTYNTSITDISQHHHAVTGVRLNAIEAVSTPIVINAAGPHSSKINDLARVSASLPIKTNAHRHEVAYLKAPPGYQAQAGFIADLDAGVYQRPDGQDMLIGSADPACDEADIVDPDAPVRGFTEQWTTQVLRAAQRWPALGIENSARGTVGLYDVSDDWIPIYDKTDLSGYYLAIGTSGNQFKNAPLVGDIMREVITADDHDRSPATLSLEHLQRTVVLDFYSRLREVQQTRSVLA